MRTLLTVIVLMLALSCQKATENNNEVKEIAEPDTVIGSNPITNELAGSAYRKRATAYYVIVHGDTSAFHPAVIEYNDGRVGLDLRFNKTRSYREHMAELKLMLPSVAKNYNLDSLNGISIGRFYRTGDLAIEVSNQYKATFGEDYDVRTTEYKDISSFLLSSKLATDFNALFNSYNLSVSDVSIEKVFFTTHKDVYRDCKVETDSMKASDRILDCITWIELQHSD